MYDAKPSSNPKKRYLQSAEESDRLLPSLIDQLGEFIDLNNTIIVYTADHGQAFGEMSYKVHSSSTIFPQINVPFALYHPKLQPRTIEHSSHFDIMPTLFDLLGLEYNQPHIGTSLGCDQIQFSHVLFSETRCGNLPSCFGHINKERKLLLDVALNYAMETDLFDNPIKILSQKETLYWHQVMLGAH